MKRYLILGFIICTMFSCTMRKQIVRMSSDNEYARKKSDSLFAKMLDKLNEKEREGKLDTASGNQMRKAILKREKDNDRQRNAELAVVRDLSPFSGKKKFQKAMIIAKEGATLVEYTMDDIEMLIEQIGQDTKQIDSKVAFATGKFEVDRERAPAIREILSVFVDSIIRQSNRRSSRDLELVLICTGYSDEQDIAEGGPLRGRLLDEIGKRDASRFELNQVLSQLRAQSIANLAYQIIQDRKAEFSAFNRLKIVLQTRGLGEAKPFAFITDYEASDERRRIVLFNYSLRLE